MSFSDISFPYGPFVPHYIPRQYIENYFPVHGLDRFLVLGTTVEDISKLSYGEGDQAGERWKLTLRKYDIVRNVDEWWEEVFDAVVIANGHYSVPFVSFSFDPPAFSNPFIAIKPSYQHSEPKDSRSQRSFRLHRPFPKSGPALKTIPDSSGTRWQKGPRNRQLRLRPRHNGVSPFLRRASGLPVSTYRF